MEPITDMQKKALAHQIAEAMAKNSSEVNARFIERQFLNRMQPEALAMLHAAIGIASSEFGKHITVLGE